MIRHQMMETEDNPESTEMNRQNIHSKLTYTTRELATFHNELL